MRARPASGFSLVELMIASALGLIVIGAAGGAFLQGSRSARQDEAMAQLDAELKFALAQLTQDLEMTGFWGEALDPRHVALAAGLAPAADCGPTTDGAPADSGNNWLFAERRASLALLGDATPAAAHALFSCIATADFHAGPRGEGSDIVAVKRVAARSLAPSARLAGHVYLGVDGARSLLYAWPAAAAATGSIYEYVPAIWYLRRASADEAATPALCRKVLVDARGGLRMQSDPAGCVAQGIEDLQLELGLDDDGDGLPDRTVAVAGAPPAETLARVVGVRVHLLGRALACDPAYVNGSAYALGGRHHAAFGDGYRRETMSAWVPLRNPAHLRAAPELP